MSDIATTALDGSGEASRLVRFYDRLRTRADATLSRRLGGRASEVLLAAPDLFILLVRLFVDRDVPQGTRALVGGALAYFVLPADLMPEALLGFGGFVDDVVLSAAVLSHVLSPELQAAVDRHWSGSRHVREVLADAAGAADTLLSSRMQTRLLHVLGRYGIDLPAASESGPQAAEKAGEDDEEPVEVGPQYL